MKKKKKDELQRIEKKYGLDSILISTKILYTIKQNFF